MLFSKKESPSSTNFAGLIIQSLCNTELKKTRWGEVKVPLEAYYGAQTQRSIDNFKIAQDINKMPKEIIRAFAHLKKQRH